MGKPKFKSKFERNIYNYIKGRGVDVQYETIKLKYDVKVPLGCCQDCGSKNVVVTKTYTPDFILPNGIILEAKGKFTAPNRTKMLAVIESNLDLDIRMVFMANNWVTRKHKQRYSDWCERNGIIYYVVKDKQFCPRKWLK